MRRPIRTAVVALILFSTTIGSGLVTRNIQCTPGLVRALLSEQGGNYDFGVFFAYLFDVPSRTGGMGEKFRRWFKAEEVAGAGKAKKAPAKLGVATYKGTLQASKSTSLVVPKKTKDKRVTITALKDGVNGVVQSQQTSTGIFDARVTVAVDKTIGLVSGQSLAGLELQRPAFADPLAFTSVVAAYTEDEQGGFLGFVVQAFDDVSGALGPSQLFETAEVELRIQQTETQLVTMARDAPAGGPDPNEDPALGWTVISSQDIPKPDDPFTLGFGASNLDKRGTFYFDFFGMGQQAPGPDLEGGMFADLLLAVLDLGAAKEALVAELPDVGLAEEELNEARGKLAAVQGELTEAMGAGTLSDQTEGKQAGKVFKRVMKGTDRLIKILEKGKAKKPSKLERPLQRVIDDTAVVLANVGGVKTTSARQVSFVPPPLIVDTQGGSACSNPSPSGGEFATATYDGADWLATTLKAESLQDGRFDIQFEDCVGEGSYLLIEFTFPGDPAVGVFNVGPFGGVTGFAKNVTDPEAFGILFGGILEITSFDPKTQTLEGTFSADAVFGLDDALDGAFRIEDFE